MAFRYTAPLPGNQVRKDFLLGNRLFRVIWGLTNNGLEIEFSPYIAADSTSDMADAAPEPTAPDAPFGLVVAGELTPIPGSIRTIREVSSSAPARAIEIVFETERVGEVVLASWVSPNERTLYVNVSAPRSPRANLYFGRMKEGAVLVDPGGRRLDPSQPIPPVVAGEWQFAVSWEDSPTWMSRCEVIGRYEAQMADRTLVTMADTVLAERANILAASLEVSRREDGRIPAGAHRAYNGAWIRDGVMDCLGMIYAGCPDMGNTLLYLLKNVPPKEGQLEENGMMVFGLHHYWAATGDDDLIRDNLHYIRDFVHGLFKPEFDDPGTHLLASGTEGYWERNWLGRACELSQNAWAVLAVRLYTELGGALAWEDDYGALNARADDLWSRILAETGFVRDGRFVKRLYPGGERQAQGLVRRGLSNGANPYADQFAKPEDYEEVMRDLDPDVQTAVPWLWGLMDPREEVSANTAAEIWKLWNQDWSFGGLERYSVFADCDRETAGPWFLASMMAARAFALQDDYAKVSKIIRWTDREFLGCGWSERISRAHPEDDPYRYIHEVLNWPGGEYLMLVYRESAGLYPTPGGLTVRPHLPPDFAGLAITGFKYSGLKYNIAYHGTGGDLDRIEFNGRPLDTNILPAESGDVDVHLRG